MARKNSSCEKEISEILADSNSDCDTEIYTDSDGSTADSDDSIADPDEKAEEPPPKKKRREFLNWTPERFIPKSFYFNNENAGIPSGLQLGNDPIDYFELFFDQKIMEYITEETNRYQQQNSSSSSTTTSHQAQWYAIRFEEMYVFLATTMLMGTVQKGFIKDYWSMDPLIITPIYRELFSRDRFYSIMRMLHFVNNDENNSGKLYKVMPIIRHMQEKFQKFFKPFQKLCIDESLLLWKGRLSFKQYIPSKRHRFGVNLFILCDCEKKYVLDFIIYAGTGTEIEMINNLGVSGSVVMKLMRPYLQKGHILYVDNWYTSPKLFMELYNQGIGAVGTVKKNRSGMPYLKEKLKRGEQVYRSCESMIAIKWMDKRDVYMLSTVHDSRMVATNKIDHETGRQIMKPACVQNYNENMGAIDLVDMQSSFTECIRKTIKWYKKVFFHMVDMASINAFHLYQTQNSKNIQLRDFRLQLIKNILSKYGNQKRISIGSPTIDSPLRLSARHFPSLVPLTASKAAAQRKCYVCSHTEKNEKSVKYARYQCE